MLILVVGKEEAAVCMPGEAPEGVGPPPSGSGCVVVVMMLVMAWSGSSRAVSKSFMEGWVMRVPGGKNEGKKEAMKG